MRKLYKSEVAHDTYVVSLNDVLSHFHVNTSFFCNCFVQLLAVERYKTLFRFISVHFFSLSVCFSLKMTDTNSKEVEMNQTWTATSTLRVHAKLNRTCQSMSQKKKNWIPLDTSWTGYLLDTGYQLDTFFDWILDTHWIVPSFDY